nr:alkaline phosphatase [Kosmotoga arenicorallina]
MGLNHLILTSYLEGRELNIMKAPNLAMSLTFSANSNVTDSAAAGTALAAGFKTNNGMIGVLPDGTPIPSIADFAAQNGVKTGIIATSRITHATPAAFYGHVNSRSDENTLAEQLVNSQITVAFGGGWRHFVPTGGKRKDGKDLIAVAKENGFDYITTKTEMLNYDGNRVLGLFAYSHLKAASERTGEEPMLPEMVSKALEILSKDNEPFFSSWLKAHKSTGKLMVTMSLVFGKKLLNLTTQ